jgi:hypothetical protein
MIGPMEKKKNRFVLDEEDVYSLDIIKREDREDLDQDGDAGGEEGGADQEPTPTR